MAPLTAILRPSSQAQFFLRTAEPAVLDLLVYTTFSLFSSPRAAFSAASLTGGVSIVVLCSHTKKELATAALIYIAYKATHFVYTQLTLPLIKPFEETPARSVLQPLSSPEIVLDHFNTLINKLVIPFDGVLNASDGIEQVVQQIQRHPDFQEAPLREKIRALWNTPEIDQMSFQLMQKAAAEMIKLMFDLRMATRDVPDDKRNQKMAQLLLVEPFSKRFIAHNKRTIFFIYWYIRNMRCSIHCQSIQKRVTFTTGLAHEDHNLFYTEGSLKTECRKLYNFVTAQYLPLLPYLPTSFSKYIMVDDGLSNLLHL